MRRNPSPLFLLAALLLMLLGFAVSAAPQAPQATYGKTLEGVTLPDARVTPGAVEAARTAAVLCSPTFRTGAVRKVTKAMKLQVCALYGVTKDCPGTAVEIDHLIPLWIGGSNDIANLWPQPYNPTPGAHQKDVIENWVHREVCAGRMTLETAQQKMRTNWYEIYQMRYPKAAARKVAK